MNKMLTLLSILISASTSNAQAMMCAIEKDRIYGVWKEVEGICEGGYPFSISGPAFGLKFEKTDFFGIACSGEAVGTYLGVGVDVGLAKGFSGAVFMQPLSGGIPKVCAVGGLSDLALFFGGISIPVLTIEEPTASSAAKARQRIY